MSDSVLYLIPTAISENDTNRVIPEQVISQIYEIDFFIVEDLRSARRFLKKIKYPTSFESVHFEELNEHNEADDSFTSRLLAEIGKRKKAGLMSEAGSPAVADPGKILIRKAQEKRIKVVPLTGPNSILLALMASGLNGQKFSFMGYLPKEQSERKKAIRLAEEESYKRGETKICIETPYRNQHLFEDMLATCSEDTLLCVAADITGANEFIQTKKVSEWKKYQPPIQKIPAVFLLQKL